MKNLLLYAHNGSGNHGCEALVRSTVEVFSNKNFNRKILMSHNVDEDYKYGLDSIIELHTDSENIKKTPFAFMKSYYKLKIKGDPYAMDKFSFGGAIKDAGENTIALSIGGDNFCYEELYKFIAYHQYSKELGQKTVLWGCSVDENVFQNPKAVNDFYQYDLVVARESLTYKLMQKNGIKNLILAPDPAFFLKPNKECNIIPEKNTVGINISPLTFSYATNKDIVYESCIYMIKKILRETDYSIALIPHVVWKSNSDMDVLSRIKNTFIDVDRIHLISDMDAPSLKNYISKLRYLVTARTHASIAAYSSGVPTIVLGYSIKSRGIATDIFDNIEHYVVPVQTIADKRSLWEELEWLMDNEEATKKLLNSGNGNRRSQMKNAIDKIYKDI